MNDDDRYPSELAERFQVRLPPGLRDRIKAYAERHGRSMNMEIVRVLEREFPEPWTLEERVASILGMIAMFKEADGNEQITVLNEALEETLLGIASGRIKGVDDQTRKRIEERLQQWHVMRSEDDHAQRTLNMDEEELLSLGGVDGLPHEDRRGFR